MSNETDLDWLARNVHVWNEPAVYLAKSHKEGFSHEWFFSGVKVRSDMVLTKDQWLARRAELQNKPSWADAPEWAQWLAQDGSGFWYWYASKPTNPGMKIWWPGEGDENVRCGKGEVLGDWRDTLERRPADLSEPAVTERLTEAAQNVLEAVPGLMDEKYGFEPEFNPVTVTNETVQLEQPVVVAGTGNGYASESAFLIGRVIDLLRTSVDHFSADELAELHQLCDAELTKRDAAVCGGQKYLDAHWFERGELPPVGIECEFNAGPFGWFVCDIVAHYNGDAVFAHEENVARGKPEEFRPIRTERDVLIEIIKKTDDTDDRIADAILAAGFSLGAK